jgi:hypothetical protein
MSFHRERVREMRVLDCETAKAQRNGAVVRVVTRQRPGIAKGFVFLSLERRNRYRECHRQPSYLPSEQRNLRKRALPADKRRPAEYLGRGFGKGGPNRGAPRRSAGDDFA